MPGKRYTAEQIVAKLREAEKLQGQGLTIPGVCKRLHQGARPGTREEAEAMLRQAQARHKIAAPESLQGRCRVNDSANTRGSRSRAIREAASAVQAARPGTREEAEAMLRQQLSARGVDDLADETIAEVASLACRGRTVAGLLALKSILRRYRRLWRHIAELAEPDWLTPSPEAGLWEPGPLSTTHGSEVILNPTAAAFLSRVARERPATETGTIPVFTWLARERASGRIRVMIGQEEIGELAGEDADTARAAIEATGRALWTPGVLHPGGISGRPARVEVRIVDAAS